MNAPTADWEFIPVTDEDRELVDAEHGNTPHASACASFATNACLHIDETGSEIAYQWKLRARLVLRSVMGEYRSVWFSADVPYNGMTIEEARAKWQGILVKYFAEEWYPAFEMGQYDE